jgi:hypothetical protein
MGFYCVQLIDTTQERWKASKGVEHPELRCLAYSPEKDVFYALGETRRRELRSLMRVSPHGAPLESIELEESIPVSDSPGSHVQLVCAEAYVLVLTTTPVEWGPRRDFVHRCYVIAPDSGRILFRTELQPQADPRGLPQGEATAVWLRLTNGDIDAAEADALMWELAAGGAPAATFMQKQIEHWSPPESKRVGALIAELDDEQFRVRETAQTILRRIGRYAVAELTAAAVKPRSPEQGLRLKSLLREIESGVADAPPLLAVRILGRNRSPAAIEYLTQLSHQDSDKIVARFAEQTLRRIDDELRSAEFPHEARFGR